MRGRSRSRATGQNKSRKFPARSPGASPAVRFPRGRSLNRDPGAGFLGLPGGSEAVADRRSPRGFRLDSVAAAETTGRSRRPSPPVAAWAPGPSPGAARLVAWGFGRLQPGAHSRGRLGPRSPQSVAWAPREAAARVRSTRWGFGRRAPRRSRRVNLGGRGGWMPAKSAQEKKFFLG
jgi:hypothetical protein